MLKILSMKFLFNKFFIYLFLIPVALTLLMSLGIGEHLELEAFLNARSSARFTKNSKNVKTVLPKGTRGEVIELKKMPSGNFGIKIKIENGPKKNQSYWVYYNLKKPLIKILDSKNKIEKSDNIAKAKKAELITKQIAYRELEEKNDIETTESTTIEESVIEISKQLDRQTIMPEEQKISANCPPNESQELKLDEIGPMQEIATSPLHPLRCSPSGFGWEQCSSTIDNKIEGFKVINNGPNSVIKTSEYYIDRTMSFEFSDRARSDMKLLVSDSPDEKTSHTTYSIMLFFPRSVLPTIKRVGDELEVTLPNKEIVRYNANTREIIGGVFTEGPIAKHGIAPNIKYKGNGVMIRADKTGDLPYGDIEKKDGKKAPSISTATISKKGFSDCKIKSDDIWYTDYQKDGQVFIKPNLSNDQGMDKFIKERCGFSLY